MPRFTIKSPQVIHETVDGEAVIVNLETGTYYMLKDTGERIWAAIARGASVPDILTEIDAAYQGAGRHPEDAVSAFLDELVQEGLIARSHKQYEYRSGQIKMAEAISSAFENKRHLVVEAGTGTGKTLAYLIPAVAAATDGRKRIIISTGTKTLQEQLFYKDVPFLEEALFGGPSPDGAPRLRVCYMKGRNNYLCRQKLYELTDQPILTGLEEIEQYRTIAEWEKVTPTGDRAELASIPEASQL